MADRPRCGCHNEPMVSPSNWQCAAKERERYRRYYAAHAPEVVERTSGYNAAHAPVVTEYQRHYYEEHAVDLNFKQYVRALRARIVTKRARLAELEREMAT